MAIQEHNDRQESRQAALCLLVVVAIFALRSPWTGSFWLDETISAWIVQGSLSDAVRRATDFQGQSPLYYSLLWASGALLGHSEAALRVLSVVFGGFALVAMFSLVRTITGQASVALVATAALLCADTFQAAVLSARPYALGVFFALASMVLLERLSRKPSQRDAALFVLSCVLCFYAHYLFAVVFLAHAWHLARRPPLARMVLGWALLGVALMLPALPQLAALFSRRTALMFAQPIDFTALFKGAVPVPAVVPVLLGAALGAVWGGKVSRTSQSTAGARFLLPYVLVPVIVFAAWSFGGSQSMWVPRYWGWQAGAWSALACVLLASMQGERARKIAIVAAFGFCLLRLASQSRVSEDWRGATEAVKPLPGAVALYSGLVEVETGASASLPEFAEYVRSPLRVYGVSAPVSTLSLSRLEADLRSLPADTSSLVVFNRKLPDGSTSKDRILSAAASAGLTLEALHQDRLVSAFAVRR